MMGLTRNWPWHRWVGCLLGRLNQVGPSNKQLAKKREWAVLQDEKMKRERHSQRTRKIEEKG